MMDLAVARCIAVALFATMGNFGQDTPTPRA